MRILSPQGHEKSPIPAHLNLSSLTPESHSHSFSATPTINNNNTKKTRRDCDNLIMSSPLLLLLLITILQSCCLEAQQQYEDNAQDNCYGRNGSSVLGYACNITGNNGAAACTSYLTFRASAPLYDSPVSISYLLGANAPAVAAANAFPTVSPVPDGQLVLVPVPCSCTGVYYQYNASYTIQFRGETYFIIANNTYQGLSTCQALIAQNPSLDSRGLVANMTLTVPLRCACPSAAQAAAGFKLLVAYLITWKDDVTSIARRFRTDAQAVLDANQLTNDSTIYPFTTLLVPLKTPPTADMLITPPPPAPPPTTVSTPPASGGSDTGKWIGVGVGAGVGVLALAAILGVLFCCYRRRRRRRGGRDRPDHGGLAPGKAVIDTSSVEYGALSGKQSSPLVSSDVRSMLESLTVYKYEELEKATGRFAEDRRIVGSAVYRAVINGDVAAVKRVTGDMTNEINILKHVNHSSIVRLSGFCVHHGDTYMVYEYAENGALSEWVHRGRSYDKKGLYDSGGSLRWKQRVQVAYDVADGLNYLHNYTDPPYVHKNLKSSNILLGADFRAKVSNFGLARAVAGGDNGEPGAQLTRHVVGTQGYMAPEYLEHGLISPQLDVFAFGVIMLELLSGKEAAFVEEEDGKKGETLLWESAEGLVDGEDVRSKLRAFMDPCLQGDYPFDLAFAMAELAVRCVARDAGSRPSMTEVLLSLSAVYNSTCDWDPSDYGNSGSAILAR